MRHLAPLLLATAAALSGCNAMHQNPADPSAADDQYKLGYAAEFGDHQVRNGALAARWYRKAAAQGYAPAQYRLGLLYEGGNGVDTDAAIADGWYSKAAAQGVIEAQLKLCQAYINGTGIAPDDSQALTWCQQAATQGDPQAIVELGLMYQRGKGVDQNSVTARQWFAKAAERGYPSAQLLLAESYLHATPPEPARGAHWLRRAAAQGNMAAWHLLSGLYQNGSGVARDLVLAEACLLIMDPPPTSSVADERDQIAGKLNVTQQLEAQQIAKAWVTGQPLQEKSKSWK